MAWPYHFSSQTPERRQSLDSYARLAQVSIIFPLVLISLLKILHLFLTKIAAANGGVAKERGQPRKPLVARVLAVWRRIAWWADDDVGSWGTRRELLSAMVWAVWLGILAVKGTGDGE